MKIQKLKFRRTWIKGWLMLSCLRHRSVSTQVHQFPSPADIETRMTEIHNKIIDGGCSSAEVFNSDETGKICGAHLLSLSMFLMMMIVHLRRRVTTRHAILRSCMVLLMDVLDLLIILSGLLPVTLSISQAHA